MVEEVKDSMMEFLAGFQKSLHTNTVRELAINGLRIALAIKQQVKREIVEKGAVKLTNEKLKDRLKELVSFGGIVCGLHYNTPHIFVI